MWVTQAGEWKSRCPASDKKRKMPMEESPTQMREEAVQAAREKSKTISLVKAQLEKGSLEGLVGMSRAEQVRLTRVMKDEHLQMITQLVSTTEEKDKLKGTLQWIELKMAAKSIKSKGVNLWMTYSNQIMDSPEVKKVMADAAMEWEAGTKTVLQRRNKYIRTLGTMLGNARRVSQEATWEAQCLACSTGNAEQALCGDSGRQISSNVGGSVHQRVCQKAERGYGKPNEVQKNLKH
jgi:hypothetical protein